MVVLRKPSRLLSLFDICPYLFVAEREQRNSRRGSGVLDDQFETHRADGGGHVLPCFVVRVREIPARCRRTCTTATETIRRSTVSHVVFLSAPMLLMFWCSLSGNFWHPRIPASVVAPRRPAPPSSHAEPHPLENTITFPVKLSCSVYWKER
jgi:hypothetical protein